MAADYVHVLRFSMVPEKLKVGVFHGKRPEFGFVPRACVLEAIALRKRQLFFVCSNIVKILGCEI